MTSLLNNPKVPDSIVAHSILASAYYYYFLIIIIFGLSQKGKVIAITKHTGVGLQKNIRMELLSFESYKLEKSFQYNCLFFFIVCYVQLHLEKQLEKHQSVWPALKQSVKWDYTPWRIEIAWLPSDPATHPYTIVKRKWLPLDSQ